MTFIEALNNETTRDVIDQIEDINSSLEAYDNGDRQLESIRTNLIAELAGHGYTWK